MNNSDNIMLRPHKIALEDDTATIHIIRVIISYPSAWNPSHQGLSFSASLRG